MLKMTKHQICD